MQKTSLKHKAVVLVVLLCLTIAAFSQGKSRVLAHSQNQPYIVLDSVKSKLPPLYQRYYTYNQLKRKGYSPVKYKGSRCMNWKWYLELTTTKK